MKIEKIYKVENIEFTNLKNAKKYIEVINTNNHYFEEKEKEEISLGIKSNIDVSIYINIEFNYLQMKEIRLGLEKV